MTAAAPHTDYTRAVDSYDDQHERAIANAVLTAIFDASKVSGTLSPCVVIRTGEAASALVTVLALVLAASPTSTRTRKARRRLLAELGKRLERRLREAEGSADLQDLLSRCFNGSDVGGHA
jgi:hypothetical protein